MEYHLEKQMRPCELSTSCFHRWLKVALSNFTIRCLFWQASKAGNHFYIKIHRFDSAYVFGWNVSVHNSAILQRITKPAILNTNQTPLASVNSSDDYSCFSQCYVGFLALILAHRKVLEEKFLHWHLNILLLTSVPWRLWTGTAYYKSAIDYLVIWTAPPVVTTTIYNLNIFIFLDVFFFIQPEGSSDLSPTTEARKWRCSSVKIYSSRSFHDS